MNPEQVKVVLEPIQKDKDTAPGVNKHTKGPIGLKKEDLKKGK